MVTWQETLDFKINERKETCGVRKSLWPLRELSSLNTSLSHYVSFML